MHRFNTIALPSLALGGLLVSMGAFVGCSTDNTGGTGTATGTGGTMSTTVTATNTASVTNTAGTVSTTAPTGTGTATQTGTSTVTVSGTGTGTGTETGTGTGMAGFDFRKDDPATYTQADRLGMPGVNTALIASADKDTYNQDAPTDDVAGTFAVDISDSLNLLHLGTGVDGNGLDDELMGPTLPHCVAPALANDDCAAQLGQFVYPDVLYLDTSGDSGFPNGRLLTDQVMDIVLALVLLDVDDSQLGGSPDPTGVDLTTFADLPLNPTMNDAAFGTDFPYLAPAN